MKKILLLTVCVLFSSWLWAQNRLVESIDKSDFKSLKEVEINKLKTLDMPNGMKVVLCEDHSQPKIWGAVCVHAGGKNDPADNTGMAHYLEHLMFKGTNQLGTTDWNKEREHLDLISKMYDELHATTDGKKRNMLLKDINNESKKAAEYAIPNEVDVVLSKMGGQGVNAFTSNDVTVYYNSFPSNQLEKWLTVYAERFRYPVFRLFQSELEAVYEEYNMYQDQPISVFMEDAIAEAYGKHPYGRPVIGYQEHLKNPQISAMQQFFNTYYHPNNMTLILVGDFDSNLIRPILESTIGNYHNEADGIGSEIAYNHERMNTDLNQNVQPFKGKRVVTVKETPVKMGIIGFQTCGAQNRAVLYLDILSHFFNNNEETGLLDKLSKDKKVLTANAFNYSMLEEGLFAFFYVPKIVGQSHEDAEAQVFAAIDSLKTGHFSDELFDAVKMSYLKAYLLNMETLDDKFNMLLEAVTNKQNPSNIYEQEKIIRQLKKEDIVKMAKQYFNDNCLIYRSNMGSKEQVKLQKPSWEPIITQNSERSSLFATKVEKMPLAGLNPQLIDFKKDVKSMPIHENFTLYQSQNPYNDFFTMTFVFNYGNLNDRLFATAVEYINGQGTREMSFDEFQLQLQSMGASMDIYSSDDRTFISISGFEKQLPKILKLCHEKIYAPGNDPKVLASLIEDRTGADKMMKDDASEWGRALYNYALYGKNSPYLTRLTAKEMKKLSGDMLLKSFDPILGSDGFVTYVGNMESKKVADIIKEVFLITTGDKRDRLVRPLKQYDKPTLFIASNGKFLQSNIYFYKSGKTLPDIKGQTNCTLYNEYMGGSMAGVIFQEIRELRSLGYSAYAAYQYDKLNRTPGYLMGYLGTQTDKTVEGCQAMGELLNAFPEKPEKFEMALTSCVRSSEADYIGARDIPMQVRLWQEQGFESDPRKSKIQLLTEKKIEDVRGFYQQTVGASPLIITIAGDKSRINLKELSKSYKIVELKYKNFIKE